MRVLLVNPPFGVSLIAQDINRDKNVNITGVPMGILYLATWLNNHGFKCDVLNCPTDSHYLKTFNEMLDERYGNDYDVIGFSVMTQQVSGALRMAKIAKRKGKITVFGGPHPTLFPAQCIDDGNIDFVVELEGEETFLELVNELSKGTEGNITHIKGIYYNHDGEVYYGGRRGFIEIDRLPLIDWNLLPEPIWEALEMVPGHTSRGCPHRCTFCINYQTKNWWRGLSSDRVIQETEHIINKFGMSRVINFQDECFFVNKERVKAILKEFKRRGWTKSNGFKWRTNVRADYFTKSIVDEEILQLMEETGCYRADIGGESGSQRMLDFLKKDIKVEDIKVAVSKLGKHGITPKISFMTGLPTETPDDTKATIRLIDELIRINPKTEFFGPRIYRPQYPGGELTEICHQMGWQGPQTLEEWAKWNDKDWNFIPATEYPWIDKKRVHILEMLEPVIRFANQPIERTVRSSIYAPKVLKFMYAIVAKIRWKLKFFGLPIEYKLAMWWLKRNAQLRKLQLERLKEEYEVHYTA